MILALSAPEPHVLSLTLSNVMKKCGKVQDVSMLQVGEKRGPRQASIWTRPPAAPSDEALEPSSGDAHPLYRDDIRHVGLDSALPRARAGKPGGSRFPSSLSSTLNAWSGSSRMSMNCFDHPRVPPVFVGEGIQVFAMMCPI